MDEHTQNAMAPEPRPGWSTSSAARTPGPRGPSPLIQMMRDHYDDDQRPSDIEVVAHHLHCDAHFLVEALQDQIDRLAARIELLERIGDT